MVRSFEGLAEDLAPAHAALSAHPLYGKLHDERWLRRFMENHVFAVWDFMSLLKTLQRHLTHVQTPWTPPRSRLAARLVNEIVLGEETDEIAPGVFQSHFELYLEAMDEVSADTRTIRTFVSQLVEGRALAAALAELPSHVAPAQRFVRATFATLADARSSAHTHTHSHTIAVASAFLLGRERLVPSMFDTMLHGLGDTPCPRLRLYLERHIHLDGEDHGPKAIRLLQELCGDSPEAWNQAAQAARDALQSRQRLWDEVLALPW
jgi:hypothetical protein